MCGRYALALSNEEVYESLQNQLPQLFERGRPRWDRQQDYRPNYNVAPRQRMPVLHRDRDRPEEAVLETMQWGLIPHWTKHPPTAQLNTINARSEALLDSSSGGMWHALKGYKRCVIPAQGYYEWLKRPSSKIAHFTRSPLAQKSTNTESSSSTSKHPYPLLFMAGLWDVVTYVSPVESRFQPSSDPENKREPYPTGNPVPLATYTILTTSPAKDIAWLHDRMPCMLSGWEEVRDWLDLGEVRGWVEGKGGTGEVLRGTSGLDCYPVPPEVGKIGTNSPTYIEPVSERADGIKSFFQKQSPAKPKAGDSPKAAKTDSAKKDVKADVKPEVKPEIKPDDVKGEALPGKDDIDPEHKSETKQQAVEEVEVGGLGDDSNAPNPAMQDDIMEVKEEKSKLGQAECESQEAEPDAEERKEHEAKPPPEASPSKRKRDDEAEVEEEEQPKTRRGGHQTRVVRREAEEATQQPAITSFFKSPKAETKAEAKAETRARGKKGKK